MPLTHQALHRVSWPDNFATSVFLTFFWPLKQLSPLEKEKLYIGGNCWDFSRVSALLECLQPSLHSCCVTYTFSNCLQVIFKKRFTIFSSITSPRAGSQILKSPVQLCCVNILDKLHLTVSSKNLAQRLNFLPSAQDPSSHPYFLSKAWGEQSQTYRVPGLGKGL